MRVPGGSTRLVGVMGWPIAHTLSPAMHNAALGALGIDAVYVALAVPSERLPAACVGLAALGFVGANVTIPHKEKVSALVTRLTPEAAAANAVNTLRVEADGTLTGHNTDILGIRDSVARDLGIETLAGQRVVILGSGGTARAAAFAVGGMGAAEVLLLNRTPERAAAVATELAGLMPDCRFAGGSLLEPGRLDGTRLVVQTTSLGMKSDDPLPLNVDRLPPNCAVLDAVYLSRGETLFVRESQRVGLPAVGGQGMLIGQGAAAFRFWFGVDPDRELMRRALQPNPP